MLSFLETLRSKGVKIGFVSAADFKALAPRLAPESHGKSGAYYMYFRAILISITDVRGSFQFSNGYI